MIRHAFVLVGAVLLVGGCGRTGGDPAGLLGSWRSPTPGVRLDLVGSAFTFESGTLVKWGTAHRTPFRVAFVLERTSTPAFALYCRGEVNVFDWRIDGDELTFRAVGRPCDRALRSVLVAGPWERVEP